MVAGPLQNPDARSGRVGHPDEHVGDMELLRTQQGVNKVRECRGQGRTRGSIKGTNPALKKPSNIPEIYAKMFGRIH